MSAKFIQIGKRELINVDHIIRVYWTDNTMHIVSNESIPPGSEDTITVEHEYIESVRSAILAMLPLNQVLAMETTSKAVTS